MSEYSLDDLKVIRPDLFTKSGITTIYKNVIITLLNCSLNCFPLKDRSKKKITKWWWDNSLRGLKADSIQAYNNWKINGFPRDGDSFNNYHNIKKSYHKLIQEKKNESKNKISADLLSNLSQSKTTKFWRLWNANFKKTCTLDNCTFEGVTEPVDIANLLADSFKNACSPNNSAFNADKYNEFKKYSENAKCYNPPKITVDMVDKAILKIANNTASSHDSVTIEHFKLSHPSIVVILAKMFTIFLDLGIVPSDFGLGITTPIPKFKGLKKTVTTDDFRGITVNPTVSKIFEHCLLPFFDCLTFSDRQFGFRKGVGCSNSIHTVRKTVNFFNKCGNTVNLGFIDIRKAFDKTNIYSILSLLLCKGINPSIVNVLESWFANSAIKVQWSGCISRQVNLAAGVRQGGILSPLLFSCYVNILLDKLELSGLGCYVNKQCLNSFMYADDLILLSTSVADLQKLINLCSDALVELDLIINTEKSHCMRIGPRYNSPCSNIVVDNLFLSWAKQTKFLGLTILSGIRFTCDWHEARSNFYKSSNAILGNLGSNPQINVGLKLITSKCLPILVYGLSAVSINAQELGKLSFAYNSIFCKLFGVKSNYEIKFCQYYCNHWEFSHLHSYYRFCFLKKLLITGRLSSQSKLDEPDLNEFNSLSVKYNLQSTDSNVNVRKKIWQYVEQTMSLL